MLNAVLLCLCAIFHDHVVTAANADAAVGVVAPSRPVAIGGVQRAIGPSPPGAVPVCTDDGGTGFINDTCQTEEDCVGPGTTTCTSKRCQCSKGYIEDPSAPSGSKQRSCVPVPSLFSACKNLCQKPYECKPGTGPMGTEMMPEKPEWSGKMCQCPGKSRYVNGYCDAGCKSSQRVGVGGECVARCGKDQILIEGECKKLAGLNEPCSDNAQCKAAFSSCQRGRCQCVSGFSAAKGSSCQAKVYTCPYGDPLKKGDAVLECTGPQSGPVCMGGMCPMAAMGGAGGAKGAAEKAAAAARGEGQGGSTASSMPMFARPSRNDSCPSGYYCYSYDTANIRAVGHCCPRAKGRCPIGEPHQSGKCDGGMPSCPYQSHSCVFVGASGDFGIGQLCCPRPCNGYDRVYLKGQCLPFVQYGDPCQVDEQCQQINGVCSGGTCTCPPKAKPVDTGGPNKYCQMNCAMDEVAMGNECKARLKLGDSCQADASFCPSGAYCNRKGVCACPCGSEKLNDKFCAPPPYCPSANAAAVNSAKKYTYCKIDGAKDVPVQAAASCPNKHYCAPYMDNIGVCCPQPDPFCPDGSKPSSKTSCHMNERMCTGNEQCFVYYTAIENQPGRRPQQGSVCCAQPVDTLAVGAPNAAGAPGGAGGAPSSAGGGISAGAAGVASGGVATAVKGKK